VAEKRGVSCASSHQNREIRAASLSIPPASFSMASLAKELSSGGARLLQIASATYLFREHVVEPTLVRETGGETR